MRATIASVIIFFTYNNSVIAQTNRASINATQTIQSALNSGIELYNNDIYSSAIENLNSVVLSIEASDINKKNDTEAIAKGYIVMCKIKLNYPNIYGAIKEYTYSFPNSALITNINYLYASYLFNNEKYAEAATIFSQIKPKNLSAKERDEYAYKNAYCLMRIGNNGIAKEILNGIINSKSRRAPSPYLYNAYYYLGYIHYINREFSMAIPMFEHSKQDNRFAALSNYHILESKFMTKDYQYVIDNGEQVYQSINSEYKPKVARILSETYYATDNASKAKYYYEIYSINSKSVTKSDNFYAGMISYSLKSYKEAVNAFKSVISTTDSIGQSAYYYSGNSYIQLKNKHAAQEAFKKASESSFDKSIQEDALFNYAKLTFDLNRDITPFNTYLNSYSTNNVKWDEIHNYMGTAFLLNKDYNQALALLNKIKFPTAATTVLSQKAAFFRAMQLIENGAYTDAIKYLEMATNKGGYNSSLTNLAQYWLAECYYRIGNYSNSLTLIDNLQKNSIFKRSNEYPTSIYNRAYTQFKLENYPEAIKDFQHYLYLPSSQRLYTNEANIRLADSYFMNKEYLKAAELFEQIAIKDSYSNPYPALQGAMAYGLISKREKKIALLEEVSANSYKNSPLYTTALYELGKELVQEVKDEEAITILNKLINNPADSTYYYKALLEMGLINANMQKHNKALEYYKTVVAKNPISEEGQSALVGIENIYKSINKPQEFLDYLDKIGLSTIKTASEKESMLFNSAEQIFLGGNYTNALKSLNKFTTTYPSSPYKIQCEFYIAECYSKLNKPEQAAQAYYNVMVNGEGAFSELATLNYAKISYNLQRYPEAIKAYETLNQIAILDNNKAEARVGMMRSYYNNKEYETAINKANIVLELTLTPELTRETNYIKAKSLSALGEREAANLTFNKLAEAPETAEGAESRYLLISDAYDAGNFTEVENLTFAFSDTQTPQAYWLARSFIVLGDAYAERDELEQAKATFNSIKENYKPQNNDNIKDLLKMRLDKLEQIN